MTNPQTCKFCEADIHNETDEHWDSHNVFCSDDCLRQWKTETEIETAEQMDDEEIE